MNTKEKQSAIYLRGLRDGFPIGLGYLAVSFSLGITAHEIGLTAIQGFFLSLLNIASAGEYAGLSAMKADASYMMAAALIVVANARYTLMSCALSQKLHPKTPLIHRLIVGFNITDELFGISIAYPGFLPPIYMYGAVCSSVSLWATGTALGVIAGNILPDVLVKAMSASIFGMFIACFVPPCRTDKRILAVVAVSFLVSYLFSVLPLIGGISESFRVIILTLLISVAAAVLMPVQDEPEKEDKE